LGATFSRAASLGNGLVAIVAGAIQVGHGMLLGKGNQRSTALFDGQQGAAACICCIAPCHSLSPLQQFKYARGQPAMASPRVSGLTANFLVENLKLGFVAPFDTAILVRHYAMWLGV
jgi:hypothetical protein